MAALAVASAASAGRTPRPGSGDSSSVLQYVEVVPSAAGPTAPGAGKATSSKLPPSAQREVAKSGGSDARALETLATSSDYGAPTKEAARPRTTTTTAPTPGARAGGASAAPVAASGTSGTSRLVWLGLVLLAALGTAAGAAVLRHRRRGGGTPWPQR